MTSASAARLTAHGKPLEIETVDLRKDDGLQLVDLAFAGVNPIDTYMAAGRVAPDARLPRTLGSEASGYLNGQPVLVAGGGLGTVLDGVYATHVLAPHDAIFALPDDVDMQQASSLGIAGLTAWNVVTRTAALTSDDRVLVMGAGGGVGLPIVHLAAHVGAQVWGQVGSPQKAEAVTKMGAAHVVVSDADGLAAEIQDFAPTAVIDPLGGAFTAAALQALVPGGRLAVFGTSAGAETTIDLQAVYRSEQHIAGYGGLRLTQEERAAGLQNVIAALTGGRLRIPVDRAVPLRRVNDAFAALGDRQVIGNIVLDLRQ